MKKIALIGSKKLSEQLCHYIESEHFGNVCGLFDDFEKAGTVKFDKTILGKTDQIPESYREGLFDAVLIAAGYEHRKFREDIYGYLRENQIPLETFIHPSSYIDKTAVVKEGTIVLINCIVDMHVVLHENVFLSSNCLLSHHVTIGGHTYLGPSVSVAGDVEVGKRCFFGINTTCIDGIKIGNNVQTAAGSVITEYIPSDVLVAGVPAKVKKEFS